MRTEPEKHSVEVKVRHPFEMRFANLSQYDNFVIKYIFFLLFSYSRNLFREIVSFSLTQYCNMKGRKLR